MTREEENDRLHQYAAAALTGLLANSENSGRYSPEGYAEKALVLAKAVLIELRKGD